MPILFMALIALGVFMVMGLMLFYAAAAESKTVRANNKVQRKDEVKPELETHTPVA
jgi:TRAP-type C4-dicarboxylate transport system permease large subunit